MKQSERSEATQARLVAVARELFGAKGYAATSIDELVANAGVTKGAFYHHFADKEAVFRRVYEDFERESVAKVAEAGMSATSAKERLRSGCRAFLELCLDPALQRICLEDGPKVLGWATWRQIQYRYSLGLIESVLEQAVSEGRLAKRPIRALAHLFFGSCCEGGCFVIRAADPRSALKEVLREMDDIVEAMLAHRSSDRAGRESNGPVHQGEEPFAE